MSEKIPEFQALGIGVIAMTYEPVSTHARFADKYDSQLTLLTDGGGRYFRKLGIFNDAISPDHRFYGIPHPGILLIDSEGRVVDKFAEEDYRNRPAIEIVLNAARKLAHQAP